MNLILFILTNFSLAFLVKEVDGPFNIILFVRNKLMTNKYVGLFFYNLFSCYFCVGIWTSLISYFLTQKEFCVKNFIAYALTGAISCIFLDAALVKLQK
jgi:hypothetical protein